MKFEKRKETHTPYSLTSMLEHAGTNPDGAMSRMDRWGKRSRKTYKKVM